jgi:hypothetical protein
MMSRALALAVVALSLTAGSASAATMDYGCMGKSGCSGGYFGKGTEVNVLQLTSAVSADGQGTDTFTSNVVINPVPNRYLNLDYWLRLDFVPSPGDEPLPYLGSLEECEWSPNEVTCPDGGWEGLADLGDGNDTVTVRNGDSFEIRGDAGADTIDSRDGNRDFIDCGPGADTAKVDSLDQVFGGCERLEVG